MYCFYTRDFVEKLVRQSSNPCAAGIRTERGPNGLPAVQWLSKGYKCVLPYRLKRGGWLVAVLDTLRLHVTVSRYGSATEEDAGSFCNVMLHEVRLQCSELNPERHTWWSEPNERIADVQHVWFAVIADMWLAVSGQMFSWWGGSEGFYAWNPMEKNFADWVCLSIFMGELWIPSEQHYQ